MVEPLDYKTLAVNGKPLEYTGEHRIDRSFQVADILPLVHIGENELVMEIDYFQRDYVYYVLYGGVSESLRNCLCFDTKLECCYLCGDFRVLTDSDRFTREASHSVCCDGGFKIGRSRGEIDIYDLVTDGYPFFAGGINVETTFNYAPGGGTVFTPGGRYSVCELEMNGQRVPSLLFERSRDLAPYLREGKNTLKLTLYNSNRNLLGPHHRHDPEPYGVGPGTFSFEGEWHGGVCPGYTGRYAFVRFGIDL